MPLKRSVLSVTFTHVWVWTYISFTDYELSPISLYSVGNLVRKNEVTIAEMGLEQSAPLRMFTDSVLPFVILL